MGFTNGIPEYGIHDKLFPDEIAERSWSFLKAMIESMLFTQINYIIEGEAILPELFKELLEQYPNQLNICFLGFTDVDIETKVKEIKAHSVKEQDWLSDKSDEYVADHVMNMVAHSKKIHRSCEENNMIYFDTSGDFLKVLDMAFDYLVE